METGVAVSLFRDTMSTTPEEREQLSQQLTIIPSSSRGVSRSTTPLKELSAPATVDGATKPPTLLKELPRKYALNHWQRLRWAILGGVLLLALLGTGLAEGLGPGFLTFGGQLFGVVPAPPSPTLAPSAIPYDVIYRSPSITFLEVETVLSKVGSPMLPYAGDVYSYGIKYHIDPAYALAFWMKESREASDGSVAAVDHNPGYTEGLASDTRCGRWACWPTWPAGIEGWYHYMRVFFIDRRGLIRVEDILPIYAPSSENNTSGYISYVLQMVLTWRAESDANK
jgi:hypothetical protein